MADARTATTGWMDAAPLGTARAEMALAPSGDARDDPSAGVIVGAVIWKGVWECGRRRGA